MEDKLMLSRHVHWAQKLPLDKYPNVKRWADRIWERRAVKRGWSVNRTYGPEEEQLAERHSAADLDALGL